MEMNVQGRPCVYLVTSRITVPAWSPDLTTATVKVMKDAALASDDPREAFAVFYCRYGDQVLRALAVTLDDHELARDATQEAMARAWRSWSQVRTFANPSGWVYRVGLNWARSRLRRVSREVLGIFRDRAVCAAEPPDPALARAVRGLSMRHRAVVVLRLYLDWSVEDVAAALDIPEGTVRSRQHTAMNHLRRELEVDR